MKKALDALVVVSMGLVGLTVQADQIIQSCYYSYVSDSNGQTPNKVGEQIGTTGYMTKSGGGIIVGQVKLAYNQSQGFEAHPDTGWKVKGWYRIDYNNGIGAVQDKDGTSLAGAVSSYTWKAGATSGTYILSVFFEPISYRLTFDWPGISSQARKYDENVNLPLAERTGYDFAGWNMKSGAGSYDTKTVYTGENFGITTDNQEVRLTPLWTEKSYAIATGSENCSVTVQPATKALYTQSLAISVTPPSPEPGVTFTPGKLNVYAGTDDSGAIMYQCDLASSMTFTMSENAGGKYYDQIFVKATYVRTENPKHWLTIHPNGGRFNGSPDNQTLTTQLVEGGTNLNTIGISLNPNGAAFRGYYDASSDGKPVYDKNGKGVTGPYWTADGSFSGTKDLDVWAYWGDPPDSYEVVFEAPDAAGIVRVDYDGRRSEGTNLVLSVIEGSNFVATAVSTNAGYSFSCWTNNLGATTNDNPWTLATDGVVTNVAVFTGNVYKVTYNGYYGEPEEQVKCVTFASTYGEPETPVVRTGYKLEGWYTSPKGKGDRIDATNRVDITEDVDLYANWSALPSYNITFDGNGAPSGSTASQTAYLDTPTVLNANGFAKTGYTFANWTNVAGKAYSDGATVTNFAAIGETATLYAVWSNNVYSVDFDGNDATGGAMEPQAFTYDVAAKLSANGFTKTGMEFVGWSTNGVTDVVYTNGEEVVNLCTGAAGDERVMLKAVWDVGDYSRAMHCMTLKWEPEITPFMLGSCWSIEKGTDVGYDRSGSDVRVSTRSPDAAECVVSYIEETDCLAAEVPSAGMLTFRCFTETGNPRTELQLLQRMKGGTWTHKSSWKLDELATDDWYDPISVDIPQTCEIGFRVKDNRASKELIIVQIDQVTWTPAGAHPEPKDGKDNVTISSAAVSDGKFKLSFTSKEMFDYNLLTNANLLIDSWGVMEKKAGTGEAIIFEPKIIDGLPQLFYKVETIQRQD